MKHWCLGDTSEHSQRRKSCREFNAFFLKWPTFLPNSISTQIRWILLILYYQMQPWSLNIFLEPIFQVFYIHIFHKASIPSPRPPVLASRKIRDLHKEALTFSRAQSWTTFSLTVWLVVRLYLLTRSPHLSAQVHLNVADAKAGIMGRFEK